MTLTYSEYCDAIEAQTDLLRGHLDGADLTTSVPSCPGWNVGQLTRHLGGGHAGRRQSCGADPPNRCRMTSAI